ncbi:MAG: HEPN domain-containing protein [Armatimonadetes bacterium]|nr:HEPN domain-containing protein [Armatimonadota bacterium]
MNRSADWLEQAKADLEHARQSIHIRHFEWACFAAQQSAEKAAKALHMALGNIVWGHSVLSLLEAVPLPDETTEALLDAARRLDRHYIPSRYPDAHPEGAPKRYYTRAEASQAVMDAEEVVNWCDQNIPYEP